MNAIEVKAMKITIPLPAEKLPTDCIPPEGQPVGPVNLTLACGDVVLTATLNGKSYKRAMKTVQPGAFAVIQGKLAAGNTIVECGLTIQSPKAAASPSTESPVAAD
jgi:hypothetical protein